MSESYNTAMADRALYVFLLSFAVGVVWGTTGSASLIYAGFAVVIAFGVLMLALRFSGRERIVPALVALSLCAVSLGIARASWSAPAEIGVLDVRVGQEVVIEGVVIDEPDRRETSTRLMVEPKRVNGEVVEHSERILISYPRFPVVSYGDRVVATGTLAFPEDFETDAGRTFSYASYLHKDGIRYLMSFAQVGVVASGEGSKVLVALFAIKHSFLDSVARTIGEPESSLLGGITVGAKESLGSDIAKTFRTVGIIHIVVLSGYNISIVADSIMRMVSYGGILPRGVSLLFGATGVILFALMTGASATVVRASLMALLVVLARSTGRVYDIAKALMIAGFFMVLHSPYILVFDPSFQLSFIATLGLIVMGSLIEKRLTFMPTTLGVREFATATIATQIFVLPMLIYQSGQLSLISLIANLLVLVVVPYAMLTGFLAGFLGWIHDWFALPFGLLAQLLLTYILFIADMLSRVPYAAVSIPPLPVWVIACMYAALAYGVFRLHGGLPWRLQRDASRETLT